MLTAAKLYNLFKNDERGQGLAEYGLILVLVAVAVVVTLTAFGGQISAIFQQLTGSLTP